MSRPFVELAVAVLTSDHGVTEDVYNNYLLPQLRALGHEDILRRVEATDGMFYLPEGFRRDAHLELPGNPPPFTPQNAERITATNRLGEAIDAVLESADSTGRNGLTVITASAYTQLQEAWYGVVGRAVGEVLDTAECGDEVD